VAIGQHEGQPHDHPDHGLSHSASHGDSHRHSHGHAVDLGPLPARVRRLLTVVLAPLVALTLVGAVLLWPSSPQSDNPGLLAPSVRAGALLDATVLDQELTACDPIQAEADDDCILVSVRLDEGSRKGDTVTYIRSLGGGQPSVSRGDRIVVEEIEPTSGEPFFAFIDFQRSNWLLMLVFAFVALALLIGRTKGLRALIALVISVIVLVNFTLPSIVNGNSPLAVALVSASVIMFIALYLSHGVNRRTTSAVIGTLVSLGITGLLAWFFTAAAKLSGLVDDDTSYLRATVDGVDLRGILLAGTLIGALGVLDDVTVTQSSAVWELHHANPHQGLVSLYKSALRIGQDHLSSVINTLLLAYAGASLPLMLLFSRSGESWSTLATGELVATEIVRTLVGSIGLMCAVPVTTALTAFLVTGAALRRPAARTTENRSTPAAEPRSMDRDFWDEA
jgi:uncharacterized membrane protein